MVYVTDLALVETQNLHSVDPLSPSTCRVLSHLLQEVDELAHVALVARRAEHVLLERTLLVQLQQHHLRQIQGKGLYKIFKPPAIF